MRDQPSGRDRQAPQRDSTGFGAAQKAAPAQLKRVGVELAVFSEEETPEPTHPRPRSPGDTAAGA